MSKAKAGDAIEIRDGESVTIRNTVSVDSDGGMKFTDDDTPDIAPALSKQEWAAWRAERLNPVTMMRDVSAFPPNPDNLVKTIAIAFDQLHDEDIRKIARRETVALLRAAAETISLYAPINTVGEPSRSPDEESARHSETYSELHELADAIECYLPEEA